MPWTNAGLKTGTSVKKEQEKTKGQMMKVLRLLSSRSKDGWHVEVWDSEMTGLGEHVLGGEWTKGLKDDSQEEGLANLVDAGKRH